MRNLNVTVPAQFASGVLSGLALAIDFLRTERDACEVQKDPAGAARAQELRDALGLVYQNTAAAQLRASVRPVNAGKRWTAADDATLRACWGSARRAAGGSEEALQGLADAVGRTPVAVALRLQSLGVWH